MSVEDQKAAPDVDSALETPERPPVAPAGGAPWSDIWRPERIPAEDRTELEDSLINICHGLGGEGPSSGPVTGETCLACPQHVGLARYGESGNPARDYRGFCRAVTRRHHVCTPRVSSVSCPMAPAKVEGARRNDRIKTSHCADCNWCEVLEVERSGTATLCRAPRGVRFVPLCVG